MTQENKINEYVLKLTGKCSVPQSLEIGHNYKITIDGSITAETRSDNENGTFNVYYKFVPIVAEIQKDNGPVIKTKDTRSMSTKLRKVIYWLWQNNEKEIRDPEIAYQETMNAILGDVEFLYRKALEVK